jgi:hypothetical protein
VEPSLEENDEESLMDVDEHLPSLRENSVGVAEIS